MTAMFKAPRSRVVAQLVLLRFRDFDIDWEDDPPRELEEALANTLALACSTTTTALLADQPIGLHARAIAQELQRLAVSAAAEDEDDPKNMFEWATSERLEDLAAEFLAEDN